MSVASRLAGALVVLILLLAPLGAHLALVMQRGIVLAGALTAAQAILVTWIASSSLPHRAPRIAACAAALLFVLSLLWSTDGNPLVASAVPHAMAYLALLAVFAASLQPGREAVVTILARRARGHLPDRVVRYTRRVTWAWCWFFGAQLLGSLLLLLFAPPDAWSLFVNLCNLPLIIAMLGAEYAYRQWRHAAQPPERLVDMIRCFSQLRTGPLREDR
jgi:uncharacterized membrane protein